jgi:hypothetical protein
MDMLKAFEALIGTWDTESKHRLIDEAVAGTATYAWLEGGKYVVLRTHFDHPQLPDALSVIGPPENGVGLLQEYFDERGVRRTYNVTIEDGVLRTWRDAPGFDQRTTAVLAEDGFDVEIELAQEAGKWVHDMRTTYRRRR